MSIGKHPKHHGDGFVDGVCVLIISNQNFGESQMPVKRWCIVVSLKRILTNVLPYHDKRK